MEIKQIREMTDEVFIDLKQEGDFIILHLDGKMEVKINRADMGYIIDVYKEYDEDLSDDDDFINSMTVWDEDLKHEEWGEEDDN